MNHSTKEQLIAFEQGVVAEWEAGELPYLIHLSGGNEDQLIDIFRQVNRGDWVFSTHRNHYHALLSGIDPDRLAQLIRTGNSMFVFERMREKVADGYPFSSDVNFLSSSILAGTCAIAAGVAWQIKEEVRSQKSEAAYQRHLATDGNGSNCNLFKNEGGGRFRHFTREEFMASEWACKAWSPRVWCFVGDGAEDEGHFYEAVMFAHGHHLPVTFILEDNNRSVETSVGERRGVDGYLTWPRKTVMRYFYTPTYPHAGSGCQHKIEFKKVMSDE